MYITINNINHILRYRLSTNNVNYVLKYRLFRIYITTSNVDYFKYTLYFVN